MAHEPRILGELSVSDVFAEVFFLYRENSLLMAGILGLAYIPAGIFDRLVGIVPAEHMYPTQALGILYQLGLLFFLFAYLVAGAALTKAIAERYLGLRTSIASAYGFALRRCFPFLGTLILVVLAYLVGLILFLIPALIVSFWVGFISFLIFAPIILAVLFWLALVFPVFIVEDRAYVQAIKRSGVLAMETGDGSFFSGYLRVC
jgi:hypothetical protein